MKLCFVGDISLNDMYTDLLAKRGPNYPFEQVRFLFDQADVVSGNLESPLVSFGNPAAFPNKTPLRASPEYVQGLKWVGFDVLNLSNNHILDYGEKGVAETLKYLDDHGIGQFGYGNDRITAKSMKVLTCESTKVGYIGYTDVVIDSPFYAGNSTRGIAKFDFNEVKEDIKKNKKQVDILVVNIHWGVEYFHLPTPDQIVCARELVDVGADIIIGHHPHILQGIEKYKHGIIAYSLGNFVFSDIRWDWETGKGDKRSTYYHFSRRNRESIILIVNIGFNNEITDYSLHGILNSTSGQIKHPYKKAASRINGLSKSLLRQDYTRFFQKEFKKFKRWVMIKQTIRRFKRIYKIRPKHISEFISLIIQWNK